MSNLYNVYTHQKRGQWGFTPLTPQGDVRTATIDNGGRVTLGKLDPIKLAPALQQRLRVGFQTVAQPKYLQLTEDDGVARGEFVTAHPDLGGALVGDLVFFVAVPQDADMTQVAAAWSQRLEDLNGDCAQRLQWLGVCSRATAYVPVKTGDAHAALVVAQWAKENNLVLVSSAGEPPRRAPAEQRHDWRNFLCEWFAQGEIERALADLGWPLSEAFGPVELVQTSTAPAAQDEWLALAQQASF